MSDTRPAALAHREESGHKFAILSASYSACGECEFVLPVSDEARPAIEVVCGDCDPARRWPQPFPSVEAARRWRDDHRELFGHEHVERVTPSE